MYILGSPSVLDGDIHVWDRASPQAVHRISAAQVGQDLVSIAGSPTSATPFIFATAHPGVIKIWSQHKGGEDEGFGTVPHSRLPSTSQQSIFP